jgi:PAS domain S-box-containing protein
MVTDDQGRVTMMNPVAEQLTGWTRTDALGRPLADVFSLANDEAPASRESPVDRVLQEGLVIHRDSPLYLEAKGNRRVPIDYSAAPIHDARGRTMGMVLIFRDESKRRRTEQALRDADRRKDEFLATLAHELRNPLAPIRSGLEVIKLSRDDPDLIEEVRSVMERQAQQMVRLIDDLLDVSRITRGKLRLQKSTVELSEVVKNALDVTRPILDEASHELTLSIPETPVYLYADGDRLAQVLANLLNNAAKYTPSPGTIRLTAEQVENEIVISVLDNGIGIPPDMLDRIFEMFAQVDRPAERGYTGLGIGLTLVNSLVEMHGGKVEVKSQGRNHGSEFTLRLPVIPAPDPSPRIPEPSEDEIPKTARRRILVVDDNKDALSMLSMMVELLGNEVCTAQDGLEAIKAAESFRPDAILMDLGMPNLSGYDAARKIRSADWGREVVLVATTGWGHDDDKRRTKDAGFDHHLVKPIGRGTLQELLANLDGTSGSEVLSSSSGS